MLFEVLTIRIYPSSSASFSHGIYPIILSRCDNFSFYFLTTIFCLKIQKSPLLTFSVPTSANTLSIFNSFFCIFCTYVGPRLLCFIYPFCLQSSFFFTLYCILIYLFHYKFYINFSTIHLYGIVA